LPEAKGAEFAPFSSVARSGDAIAFEDDLRNIRNGTTFVPEKQPLQVLLPLLSSAVCSSES
jgi:hypothetical protein